MTTSILFLKEDDLNFFENGKRPKTIMQPKTIKSKNNGCGTALGNLVIYIIGKSSNSGGYVRKGGGGGEVPQFFTEIFLLVGFE
jgi:hypothetical protein